MPGMKRGMKRGMKKTGNGNRTTAQNMNQARRTTGVARPATNRTRRT